MALKILKGRIKAQKHSKTVAEKLQNKIDNLVNSIMQNTHI